MSMHVEILASDSALIEAVLRGQTLGDGFDIRPADSGWHLVFVQHQGEMRPLIVGPWTTAGVTSWEAAAEILWVKLKPGVFMPHLPFTHLIDRETMLPSASGDNFWLKSAAWQPPTFDNVETFIQRLVHDEILVRDPLIEAVLQGQPHDLSMRTVRHRFLQATGMSQNQLFQIERAQKAADLLQQGVSILDTMFELDYYDQPHLTRCLKQWIGRTPNQLLHLNTTAIQISQVDTTV